jgi:CubicO group peptidase (beta-lactamase class C family)
MGQFLRVSPPQPLPEFLAERPFEPLGMKDTDFEVPVTKRDRFTSYYRRDPAGVVLELAYAPDGQWSHLPAFPAGSGGLAATVDDWHRFARMLLVGGTVDARRVLSSESVQQMTTNHLTPSQREIGALFLEGQGWGFGGSVDVEIVEPWNVPGRYGWVGAPGPRHTSCRPGGRSRSCSPRSPRTVPSRPR